MSVTDRPAPAGTPLPAPAGTDRWQALKDYLATQIRQDLAVAESFPRGGPVASGHFALVSANRSTLGVMRRLEAQPGAEREE